MKESEWETNKNRGPLRHTTPKKELELHKSINEMIKKGIVEKSTASYYSHPVVVQQTPDKVRVCMDFRGLNACIEPASWPLPNIKGLFEQLQGATASRRFLER